MKEEKRYLCIVCKKNEIKETREVHPPEGDIPDQNNFDLNTYSDYAISGGRLLKNRFPAPWESIFWEEINPKLAKKDKSLAPFGGICDSCLQNEIVKGLSGYIEFEN